MARSCSSECDDKETSAFTIFAAIFATNRDFLIFFAQLADAAQGAAGCQQHRSTAAQQQCIQMRTEDDGTQHLHGCVEHASYQSSWGQDEPPNSGSRTIERTRRLVPPPHEASHGSNAPHPLSLQSIGQGAVPQTRSLSTGHSCPPLAGSRSTSIGRRCIPPPQPACSAKKNWCAAKHAACACRSVAWRY